MKSNKFELQVDSRLENLEVIADFVATSMKQLGIEEGTYQVQLAVDEACSNIIKYAYSDWEGIISIACELQDNEFVITIGDKGSPFDPNSVPPPDMETDWDERSIGGLGIYMMRKLMDEVSYSYDTEKGNRLTMRKKLTRTKRKP